MYVSLVYCTWNAGADCSGGAQQWPMLPEMLRMENSIRIRAPDVPLELPWTSPLEPPTLLAIADEVIE
ncbi:MAG: hypothetical protein WAN75_05370 [Xanthobacteraceae bacterium]|jgi:hypothetical protein